MDDDAARAVGMPGVFGMGNLRIATVDLSVKNQDNTETCPDSATVVHFEHGKAAMPAEPEPRQPSGDAAPGTFLTQETIDEIGRTLRRRCARRWAPTTSPAGPSPPTGPSPRRPLRRRRPGDQGPVRDGEEPAAVLGVEGPHAAAVPTRSRRYSGVVRSRRCAWSAAWSTVRW
jgi:hypothetical protein